MNLSIKAKLLDFNKITFIALGLAGFMLSACQSTNPKLVNGNKPIESSVVIEVVDTAPSVFTFNTYLLNGITQEASILIESQILAESISLLPASFQVLDNSLLLPPPNYLSAESAFTADCANSQQCLLNYNKTGKLLSSILLANRDSTAQNASIKQARQVYIDMAQKGLTLLYKKNPKVRAEIESAVGYGVFEVNNFNVVLYVAAYGKGLIVDNTNKHANYLYLVRSGTGPGLGFEKVYAIFVFKNRFALDQFTAASAVGGDIGASATLGWYGTQISFNPMIDVYLLDQYGFDIQANWGASLYFLTPGLN